MTDPEACRRALDGALAASAELGAVDLSALAALPSAELDRTLAAFAGRHGAAALPLLTELASRPTDRAVKRAAKRAIYRLAQRGVMPAPSAPHPIVDRPRERAVRAWLSSIDGTGSRATWILFERSLGELRLCSLIVNDTVGILDAAGGDITKKRLHRELEALRAAQKLPWVETDPERVVGLVAEALALHRARATSPPEAFRRWTSLFEHQAPATAPPLPERAEPALVERSATLLDRPELAGWFLEPESVHGEALELLQARESRLVVSDQVKTERQEALVTRVVERELTDEARRLWSRRLAEMALLFDATGDDDLAHTAHAAALALVDPALPPARHAFVRGLAQRALEVAGEIALGRLSATEARRTPQPAAQRSQAAPTAGHPPSEPGSPSPLQRSQAAPPAGHPPSEPGSPPPLQRSQAAPTAGHPPSEPGSPSPLQRSQAAPTAGHPPSEPGSPSPLQ